jgi:hypothetical protein
MRQPFEGNIPANVNKDAKYSIKREQGKWVVQLVYRLSYSEKALLATGDHPDLVNMVNAIKDEIVGQPGGAFYINEFRQVIVPANNEYYCAGHYDDLLIFDFEDKVISAEPGSLEPGNPWEGPHAGIPYTLTAGAKDIKFERRKGQRIVTEFLSVHSTAHEARLVTKRLAEKKGSAGGRIYINERQHFFAPITTDEGVVYHYIGSLGDGPWFEEPACPA